ncbi:MAG TPA: pantoate--beta-alanine ligase [Polyangiaceae bacterium]|nr:pantoate--beta-alanine ligase [Polyangiaceae bacterium]
MVTAAEPTLVRLPSELRAACDQARAAGWRVAFVPTMGALHDGHLALVREARTHGDFVVVSVFVNPTQFGPNEDFSRYPRDLQGDARKLASVPGGVEVVFAPDPGAMYPEGEQTRVHPGALASGLCGPFRPGHFEGVATVVAKLFSIVGPCTAVFGRKDYQQLAIVRRMARDLFMPVSIAGHPIVREKDGLAMSSRNAYLSPSERERALCLARGLSSAARAFSAGERSATVLERAARAEVERGADTIDYVSVVDPDSLQAFSSGTGSRALVAIACRIGKTRLIDNAVLGEDPSPLPVAPGAKAG